MSSTSGGREILSECTRLRKHYLEEFARKYQYHNQGLNDVGIFEESKIASGENESRFRYSSYEGYNTLHPFVLLLGNHSSGKSSFINYLLGRKVQATGNL